MTKITLKLSGEILKYSQGFGIDPNILSFLAKEICEGLIKGNQLSIVIGGGNIFRGEQLSSVMNRATADYMGMLATVMNSIALQDAFESLGQPTRVMSAIDMKEIAEPYIRRRALRHLEKGRIVIFAAGIGSPYFTTDTAAALRAIEMESEILLKGTKVDGIYNKDPKIFDSAIRYESITYLEAIDQNLQVMDMTAITLCRENSLPIRVFDVLEPENLTKILSGDLIGTLIS